MPKDETFEVLADPEHLMTTLEEAREKANTAKELVGRIEYAIIQQIQANGGTALPSETYICELKIDINYDITVLARLKEEMNSADLAHCWEREKTKTKITPAHFKTIETKATCIRNGGKQARILKESMTPGAPKLKFERR